MVAPTATETLTSLRAMSGQGAPSYPPELGGNGDVCLIPFRTVADPLSRRSWCGGSAVVAPAASEPLGRLELTGHLATET